MFGDHPFMSLPESIEPRVPAEPSAPVDDGATG
jgi:hypothetical protein